MCGVIGIVGKQPVAQWLYDGLLVLQHRGQDAAGIVTSDGRTFYMHKNNGLVADVFQERQMQHLVGNVGIGHVRYPTAGCSSVAEAQPFYVNSPFGIVLGHNGNLTNSSQVRHDMLYRNLRHINTTSDSEVLLNVLAYELQQTGISSVLDVDMIFGAVSGLHQRVNGAYAVVAMIANYGLLAFRDPYGIRPLVFGKRDQGHGTEYIVASESAALDVLGFELVRDVAPGEVIFISMDGDLYSRQCAEHAITSPCIFEYVYLARPDSLIDGASVYQTRLNMGDRLAAKMYREWAHLDIDAVIPIPETSRPCAMQMANLLNLEYREGFVKNRYIGRTFIMPGQVQRKKSVRQKLNPTSIEFKGKNVVLVDDSVVRGTTSRQIVEMAREAGAHKVYFASAAPPVRYPNVYGIDMPARSELLAAGRDHDQICHEVGADALIYQDLEDLIGAVNQVNPALTTFDCSCFDGHYVTGDITPEYLAYVESMRGERAVQKPDNGGKQMDLQLVGAIQPGVDDLLVHAV